MNNFKPINRDSVSNWLKNEVFNLVYLVENLGKEWTMFSIKYKEYFHDKRTPESLLEKYEKLKANLNSYEALKMKAQSLVKLNRNETTSWSHEECLYLVFGVKQYGHNWESILENFGQYFDKTRSENNLKQKYFSLINDQQNFNFLLKEVKKLLEEE